MKAAPDEQLPLYGTPPSTTSAPPAPAAPPPPPALGPGSPLKAAIVAWCDHLRRENSPENTIKAFGGDLRQLSTYVGAAKNLGQVTTRELNDWLVWQRTVKRCSPKTYARRITSLKSFFRWLSETNIMPHDPAAAIIQQTVLSPLPDILSAPEVKAALAAAEALGRAEKPDLRPYVLFGLLLETGIKKGECLALVPNHVDLSNPDEPVLWVRYPNPRYRFKERKLKLSPAWVAAYREYLAQFAPRDKLFPWSARRLEYMLEDIGKLASIPKRLSFDMCRWTCAVREAQAGTDLDRIRQKLGLSKVQWREIGSKLKKLVEPAL
jgi:site-specific recombinase XerD